ncbi:hypothetical protein [Sphingomonas phyllosphaerae]|uniref:hypothetical protein n=1 Tax=Sphingomonas phyllosphaerae TaxID=257003 RepID=UPI0012DFA96B|nr:hypothetical protein [Sphingomonas phyllosphaerae]
MKKIVLGCALLIVPAIAGAQSTTTYTYDALGRLVGSATDRGPGASTTTIEYDPAGNRKTYKVSGAANGADEGAGASVPSKPRFVVVPLNGFTLIPLS